LAQGATVQGRCTSLTEGPMSRPMPRPAPTADGNLTETMGSYYKVENMGYLGTGMGVSPLYHRHQIAPNVVEYDEIGYGYDERYSSPILEIPETIYHYLLHPVAAGTVCTGKAIVGGTGAVLGAGYSGVKYVAGTAYDGAKYVGSGVHSGALAIGDGLDHVTNHVSGHVAHHVGRGVTNAAGTITDAADKEDFHSYMTVKDQYYQGRRITHTGDNLSQPHAHPLASGRVVQSTMSPFATAQKNAGAGVQEVDKVDSRGRVVERDLIIQRGEMMEIDKYDAAGNIIERDFYVAPQPPPPPVRTATEVDKLDASGRNFERDLIITGPPAVVTQAPVVYKEEVVLAPVPVSPTYRAAPTSVGTLDATIVKSAKVLN